MWKQRLLLIAGLMVVAAPMAPGDAEASPNGVGLRGGITDDVDAFFFGGHVAIHPARIRKLVVEPSLELGFAESNAIDFTLRANLHFKILFPVGRQMAFYPLFGPSLYYVNWDEGYRAGGNSELGMNLGMGFEISGFGVELALGLPDDNVPDFSLTFLYTFW
jgi:hypothetical protein